MDVPELKGAAAAECRPGALAQVGGDDAEGREVAAAALQDLDVAEAGVLGSMWRAFSAAGSRVVRSRRGTGWTELAFCGRSRRPRRPLERCR